MAELLIWVLLVWLNCNFWLINRISNRVGVFYFLFSLLDIDVFVNIKEYAETTFMRQMASAHCLYYYMYSREWRRSLKNRRQSHHFSFTSENFAGVRFSKVFCVFEIFFYVSPLTSVTWTGKSHFCRPPCIASRLRDKASSRVEMYHTYRRCKKCRKLRNQVYYYVAMM